MSQFWLRGLCSSSTLDTVYKLRQDLSNVHLIQNRHLSAEEESLPDIIRGDVSSEVHQDGFFTGLGKAVVLITLKVK